MTFSSSARLVLSFLFIQIQCSGISSQAKTHPARGIGWVQSFSKAVYFDSLLHTPARLQQQQRQGIVLSIPKFKASHLRGPTARQFRTAAIQPVQVRLAS
jgi:hypothetical protein